jgi:hypothetical protein
MSEMVLPGVYIEVRPEGLIVPGRVGVGTIGVVGTASRGPVDDPVSLGGIAEARAVFGPYDPWDGGLSNELTLVRALELAFANGATRAVAVRVGASDAQGATLATRARVELEAGGNPAVLLEAASPGTWGGDLQVSVGPPVGPAFIEGVTLSASPFTLASRPVLTSARNRIGHRSAATGAVRWLTVGYDGSPAPGSGGVQINRTTGALTFGDQPQPGDTIIAHYATQAAATVVVRLMRGLEVAAEESYTVVSGADLARDVNNKLAPSALVKATGGAAATVRFVEADRTSAPLPFSGGSNAAAAGEGDYDRGLGALLGEAVHIIVAAGQDASFGDKLDAHVQTASTDVYRADRIGVLGSGVGPAGTVDGIRGHTLASDRIVFVAPGIRATDVAAPGQPEVQLPGAYAAAAVAGLLSRYPAHVSMTNKTLAVGGVEVLSRAQVTELVTSRVLVAEQRQGPRIVRGITTSTNTAWQQITTRRIVDYAKYGVRSAAEPYIGLLNNERVRGALRATINSFLTEMVDAEMLVSYQLDVSATRDEQIKGIARVNIVLQPVFSIDFIQVTMFLA